MTFKVGDRVSISRVIGGGTGTILGKASRPAGAYRVETYDGTQCIHGSLLTLEEDEEGETGECTGIALDIVSHPAHYTSLGVKCKGCGHDIECIDVVEHMNFNLGNVVKYAWRVDDKDEPIENLRKARQYLDFEIARREREK